MLITLQAEATYLAIAVESLLHVALSRHLRCKLSARSAFAEGEEGCLHQLCVWLAGGINSVHIKRSSWQDCKAELAIQKTIFFMHFCSGRFVSACHPLLLHRFLISQTTGLAEGHNKHVKKVNAFKKNLSLTHYYRANIDSPSFLIYKDFSN